MKKLKAMKSVYCYYFPEIQKLIDVIVKNYPHDVFLKSIKPGLDDFDKPIFEKLINFYKGEVCGLNSYKYRYPTSGSSEAIFHVLSYLKIKYPKSPIYTLEGEYEGYKEVAKGLEITILEVQEDMESIKKLRPGIWFISNPSARNGNIIDNKFITMLCDLGHRIIYDLSYIGTTRKYEFDVSNPNIICVMFSMSKPFGLFYYRLGFTFCRESISTLYGTKWFKNIFSLILANKVFSTFNSRYFYKKYSKIQNSILEEIYKETSIPIQRSDVFLLGYIDKNSVLSTKQLNIIKEFDRKSYYRFCLTRYFLEK